MQRGLRFCGRSEGLWIEYARLEMIHVSKIAGRRKILGLDVEEVEEKSRRIWEDDDENTMTLPAITAEDIMSTQPPSDGTEQEALEKLKTGPALSGAIPVAIFDAAMKHIKDSDDLCRHFFDMVADFPEVPCQQSILSHIMDTMSSIAPQSPRTLIRWIQQPVLGIDVTSTDFPALFGRCLDRMKESFEMLRPISTGSETAQPIKILGQQVIAWMQSYPKTDLDVDVCSVLCSTIRKVESMSGRL